ncbi:MAG: TerB family tellurite resistance protein [Melioribacteraceae bacterium]|nr:TerB family tellurite resistance protein [Melioribacteraceae bacterium]
MNTVNFQQKLFESVFLLAVCDGEFHEDELNEIKNVFKEFIIFDGMNQESEINKLISLYNQKGITILDDFFEEIKQHAFPERNRYKMIEVLLKITFSDKRIDKSEIKFIQHIVNALELSIDDLIMKFPNYATVFLESSLDTYDFNFSEIDLLKLNNN